MKVIKVLEKDFEKEVLKSNIPVLADFNADWCGPCRMLGPILDEISNENDKVKIVSINVDDNRDLALKYGISSIPCMIFFKDGKEKDRVVGLRSKEDIETILESL